MKNRIDFIGLHMIVVMLMSCVALSCSRSSVNQEFFDRADSLTDTHPDSALAILRKLDRERLGKADRARLDLLTVKALDKAYVIHTSDSLILSVIDYYADRPDDSLWPEVLYYGGRVYSDLGDYPAALDYFQKSLDLLDSQDDNPDLRVRILSQTGRLLNTLRMYREAIPCLEQSVRISQEYTDTFSTAYDYHLLGAIYQHLDSLDHAEENFRTASGLAQSLNTEDRAFMNMYLAMVKYRKGVLDSALLLIRDVPRLIDARSRNTALDIATRIYLAKNIPDTAFAYAHQLSFGKDSTGRKNGMRFLLSEKLREFVPKDSLYTWLKAYDNAIEHHLNRYDKEGIRIQRAEYNYNRHLRERSKAEKSNSFLQKILYYGLIVLLASIALTVYLLFRNAQKDLKTSITVNNLVELRESCGIPAAHIDVSESDSMHASAKSVGIRQKLMDELNNLDKNSNRPYIMPAPLRESKAYDDLRNRIDNRKIILENDPLWRELEEQVIAVSPEFKKRFRQFADCYTSRDLHLAILIKCGIRPKDMEIVFGKEKGTISYYRRKLCELLLGENGDTKVLDNIIHLL